MLNLFTEYYIDNLLDRHVENEYCILENISNPYIDTINLFINTETTKEINSLIKSSPKVYIIYITSRLTYNMFFDTTSKYPQDINILCNTDMFYNESIHLSNELQDKQCYTLLRYHINKPGESKLHGPVAFSQDTWIFNGTIPKINGADFTLGINGCDGRIAKLLQDNKYQLSNPCNRIISHHLHLTNKRNYMNPMISAPKPWGIVEPSLPINTIIGNNFDIDKLNSLKINRQEEPIF